MPLDEEVLDEFIGIRRFKRPKKPIIPKPPPPAAQTLAAANPLWAEQVAGAKTDQEAIEAVGQKPSFLDIIRNFLGGEDFRGLGAFGFGAEGRKVSEQLQKSAAEAKESIPALKSVYELLTQAAEIPGAEYAIPGGAMLAGVKAGKTAAGLTKKTVKQLGDLGYINSDIVKLTKAQVDDIIAKKIPAPQIMTPERIAANKAAMLAEERGAEKLSKAATEEIKKAMPKVKAVPKAPVKPIVEAPKPPPGKPPFKGFVKGAGRGEELFEKVPAPEPLDADKVLTDFAKVLTSPEGLAAWASSQGLKKAALSQRFAAYTKRLQEVVDEGKSFEEAINKVRKEVMTGELPYTKTKLNIPPEVRAAAFQKVFQVLKGNAPETMATAKALTRALEGHPVPRIPGVKGGSAYTRLVRVFGEDSPIIKIFTNPEDYEAILKAAEPGALDEALAEYLRGLRTVPSGQARLFEGAPEPSTLVDARTIEQKRLALEKLLGAIKPKGITTKLPDFKSEQLAFREQGVTGKLGVGAPEPFTVSPVKSAADRRLEFELLATELAENPKGISGFAREYPAIKKTVQPGLFPDFETVIQSDNPKWWHYIHEIFINSLLSGTKTLAVNTMTTATRTALEPVDTLITGLLYSARSKITGVPQQRFPLEAVQELAAMKQGFIDGVRAGWKAFRYGMTLEASRAKSEMARRAFKGKTGAVINVPARAMEATDAFFYAINYRMGIAKQSYRIAKQLGLKGEALAEKFGNLMAAPTIDMTEKARALALENLFRRPAGKTTKAIMGARESFVPLRFLLPFIRTPVNLAKVGLEMSPLGVFNPKLIQNLAKKRPEAAEQLSKIIIGSAFAGAIYIGFKNGKITAAAPRDAASRDRFFREGKQEYSIRIGNTWISYQRLEPFNQVFTQVAALVETLDKEGKVDQRITEEQAMKATMTLAQNFVSQSYMSNLAGILDALEEPEKFGGRVLVNLATGIGIPFSSLTRTAALAIDPTIRKPENLLERFKTQIPGLSQTVPARLSALGQETKRETPFFLPINISSVKETPVTREIERLKFNIGFVSAKIGEQELSSEQKREYQKISGLGIIKAIESLIALPVYRKASDEEKKQLLQRVTNNAREAARETMKIKYRISGKTAVPTSAPGSVARKKTDEQIIDDFISGRK